jgi:hypothetical protein
VACWRTRATSQPGPGFELYKLPRKEFQDFLAQHGEKLLEFRDPWHGKS